MKIDLGVCTWTFGDLPLEEIAQRLQALGFDGVELVGDPSLYTAKQAAAVLADHGLRVLSLTPETYGFPSSARWPGMPIWLRNRGIPLAPWPRLRRWRRGIKTPICGPCPGRPL